MALTEDILLIHYAELAESPVERLHRLGLISVLLNKPPDFYAPSDLGLVEDDWSTLYDWVQQGNGRSFWSLEAQGLHIQRLCEKHIVIGTSQLLTDLQVIPHVTRSPQQPTIDAIWRVARNYVMNAITLEMD